MDHANLGASSAERWMNCAASIGLSEGMPDMDTEYSREGTSAHGVLHKSLTRGVKADVLIGTTVEEIEVDGEMTAAVQTCMDLVEAILREAPDAVIWLEQRFTLAALNPPGPMWGTADIVIFSRFLRKLWIVDYKHGQGTVVSVVRNPQVRYYGLGALLKLEKEFGPGLVDWIELIIVQPRASHPDGIIRREIVSYEELAVDFEEELMRAAEKVVTNPGPPVAGRWCKFCRAAPICPALQALTSVTAQLDFADDLSQPPIVEFLSMDTMIGIHERAPIIHAWLNRIAEYLQHELEHGREIPGFKLVKKMARRKWRDENEAAFALEAADIPHHVFSKTEILTPPSLEKIIGKNLLAQFESLIVKESSGLTIAPETDERPAEAIGAVFDFTDIP